MRFYVCGVRSGRTRPGSRALAALALTLPLLLSAAAAAGQQHTHPGRVGFLTGRSALGPETIARDSAAYLRSVLGG